MSRVARTFIYVENNHNKNCYRSKNVISNYNIKDYSFTVINKHPNPGIIDP